MTCIRDVFEELCRIAPLELQMGFDNAGFQIGHRDRALHRALLALDMSDAVAQEAKERGAELIITHHPLIFSPLKAVSDAEPVQKRVLFLVENGIALICMHTNLDIAEGGVNDVLIRLLGAEPETALDADGCAGFAFGGSEADEAWTALCLDAGRNLLHYEGYALTELSDYEPMAITRFDFSENRAHHVTLVCENEIVVLYIDDQKALSSRIGHSTNGANIGVFASDCDAVFSNITMKIP